MNITGLREMMLLPMEEIIINQSAFIRGKRIHFLSITRKKGQNCLWLLQEQESPQATYDAAGKTNRELMLFHLHHKPVPFISALTIQGRTMHFTSASTEILNPDDTNSRYFSLYHFIERGFNFGELEALPLDRLVLTAYIQQENEVFPPLVTYKKPDISITLQPYSYEIPLEIPLSLSFGQAITASKVTYVDSETEQDAICFINTLESYDIWGDDSILRELGKQGITLNREQEQRYYETLQQICPIGQNLAVLTYEAPDNRQLVFYTKEHLDTIAANASPSGMLMLPSQRTGVHGYPLRICPLGAISKDFTGIMELELFSYYHMIPAEMIIL